MPETIVRVRWPDDTTTRCYSPSSTTRDYFTPGRAYPIAEFVKLSRAALMVASERVRQRYGYACSSAAHTLQEIERRAASFDDTPEPVVTVLGFE